MWVIDRDEGCRHRQAEDGYINFFLTHVVIPYLGPYILGSLMEGSQLEHARVASQALVGCSLNLLTARISSDCQLTVTDCFVCRYPCIYDFIMPMCSSCPHVICIRCSLVYTGGASCVEIPNWQFYQRSICSTNILGKGMNLLCLLAIG